ncbi:MAG: ABC transporter substrate-binding protein [Candidatus Binatia bacterium]
MNRIRIWPSEVIFGLALVAVTLLTYSQAFPASQADTASRAGKTESLEELYEKAKKEGGRLNLYLSMSSKAQQVTLPAFRKRFPGIEVDQIDATSDKLVARAVTEARGGKVHGDIFGGRLGYIAQMREQKLLTELAIPEAAAYPTELKGPDWVATDLQFIIVGWNTTRVKKADEPKQFEDLADPKWKNNLIAEPRDFQLLIGLAKRKYNNDEKAVQLLKKIAANSVEFHKGHSQLAELLVAGQASVCLTCYSHHFPTLIKKGAPLDYMLSEGIGEVGGTVAILKGAPHPNTALLWARWATSEEGQRVYAQAGETPAHPKVEPTQKTRPVKNYALSVEDVREFSRYEKLWKEIFTLR